MIRPFVGSERRGACERRSSSGRLRRSQNWTVADVQRTQNAGHGVVVPSGRGIAAIPWVEHGRAIDVPRTSVRDALMTDGETMPSVNAAG